MSAVCYRCSVVQGRGMRRIECLPQDTAGIGQTRADPGPDQGGLVQRKPLTSAGKIVLELLPLAFRSAVLAGLNHPVDGQHTGGGASQVDFGGRRAAG